MTSAEDRRRSQLLDAALAAFIANGYSKASMSSIAINAGVSRPTLYRVFPDKQAIFLGVAERLHDETLEACRTASKVDGTLDERLVAIALAKLATHMEIVNVSAHGIELLDLNQRIGGELASAAKAQLAEIVASVFFDYEGLDISPRKAALMFAVLLEGWEHRLAGPSAERHRNWRHDVKISTAALARGLAKQN